MRMYNTYTQGEVVVALLGSITVAYGIIDREVIRIDSPFRDYSIMFTDGLVCILSSYRFIPVKHNKLIKLLYF